MRKEKKNKEEIGVLSQWQLTKLRFSKHKLASISLMVLIIMYFIAIFCEFFAPMSKERMNLDYIYCPPMVVKFSFSKGFYTNRLIMDIDPVTLQKNYKRSRDDLLPLGFIVRGDEYKMWGLLKSNIHFFGLDKKKYKKWQTGKKQQIKSKPEFYLFGADVYGRGIFSRLIYGSRISLSIGLVGVLLAFFLGVAIGGISGYFGGWIDNLIQRSIEILNALPKLPLWLALSAAVPDCWPQLGVYFMITILLSLLGWTSMARAVRGKILSLREEDYAVAAKMLGASDARVLFRHLVPGFTSYIIVCLTLQIPGMILGETSLSFLGLGLKPPMVSWGVMLSQCMDIKSVAYYPWLLTPVVFLVAVVLTFNFVGDGLRDAADPYSSH